MKNGCCNFPIKSNLLHNFPRLERDFLLADGVMESFVMFLVMVLYLKTALFSVVNIIKLTGFTVLLTKMANLGGRFNQRLYILVL